MQCNPSLFSAYCTRALVYGKLGEYKKKISDLYVYLKHNSESFFAYLARGEAKSAIGDYKGAIKDYGKNIEFDPESRMG